MSFEVSDEHKKRLLYFNVVVFFPISASATDIVDSLKRRVPKNHDFTHEELLALQVIVASIAYEDISDAFMSAGSFYFALDHAREWIFPFILTRAFKGDETAGAHDPASEGLYPHPGNKLPLVYEGALDVNQKLALAVTSYTKDRHCFRYRKRQVATYWDIVRQAQHHHKAFAEKVAAMKIDPTNFLRIALTRRTKGGYFRSVDWNKDAPANVALAPLAFRKFHLTVFRKTLAHLKNQELDKLYAKFLATMNLQEIDTLISVNADPVRELLLGLADLANDEEFIDVLWEYENGNHGGREILDEV